MPGHQNFGAPILLSLDIFMVLIEDWFEHKNLYWESKFRKKVKVFLEFNWKWNLLCNMTSQWEFKSPEKSESVMWLPFLWLWSYSNHPLNRSCFGYPNWILAEVQKPKTFWVATFYAQNFPDEVCENVSQDERFCLSRHCQKWMSLPPPLSESQQISPNRAKNGVGVLNKTHGKLCRSL